MNEEYVKNFKAWNEYKEKLDKVVFSSYFYEREIWWCALGVNIGSEQDGKNAQFERPVVIVRRINSELLIGVPLSSKIRKDKFRLEIHNAGGVYDVLLSQIRVISSRRLLRKGGTLKLNTFLNILIRLSLIILENR